jgi:capsule polysaccharide export protein KpsE/RkpR
MATETHTYASTTGSSASVPAATPELAPNWLRNLRVLWQERVLLSRITGIAFIVSLAAAFLIPKMYVSQASIMPPEMSESNSTLLAALAGRAFGSDALGGLALGLMGGRNNGALFVDLLQSGSITSRIIDRFQLQSVYHKRYRADTAKALARRTHIALDKKSGVLTLSVRDTNPTRARDMAQAYLDELNILVNRTSSSSARQERIFIEKRLAEVKDKLMQAQDALSDFSSSHAAIDLKEQARATVESEAKVQGELIAAQGELESLRQVYGDANVRVRAAEARIASLKGEIAKIGGSAAPSAVSATNDASTTTSYLPLRQVPRLAVPFANLYREAHVQETVYDLLTQQYEIARLQEAKNIPVVRIIDAPGIPEKKSFPPRAVLTLASTLAIFLLACCVLLARHYWLLLDPLGPRRAFAREVVAAFRSLLSIARRSSAHA